MILTSAPGGAGMPYPQCNPSDLNHPPPTPAGMRIEFDKEVCAAQGWSREFDDPSRCRQLVTLEGAAKYIIHEYIRKAAA
jgi:hypothetical protein